MRDGRKPYAYCPHCRAEMQSVFVFGSIFYSNLNTCTWWQAVSVTYRVRAEMSR